jgi:formamidopyrimidine-DNA glycosylase
MARPPMPELPDVEVVRDVLNPILGQPIAGSPRRTS